MEELPIVFLEDLCTFMIGFAAVVAMHRGWARSGSNACIWDGLAGAGPAVGDGGVVAPWFRRRHSQEPE